MTGLAADLNAQDIAPARGGGKWSAIQVTVRL